MYQLYYVLESGPACNWKVLYVNCLTLSCIGVSSCLVYQWQYKFLNDELVAWQNQAVCLMVSFISVGLCSSFSVHCRNGRACALPYVHQRYNSTAPKIKVDLDSTSGTWSTDNLNYTSTNLCPAIVSLQWMQKHYRNCQFSISAVLARLFIFITFVFITKRHWPCSGSACGWLQSILFTQIRWQAPSSVCLFSNIFVYWFLSPCRYRSDEISESTCEQP